MKTALFTGSFDPFTLGHKSIVDRTLTFADEVIIAIGVNEEKKTMFTIEQRTEHIRKVFAGNSRVKVIHYEGLTVDLAKTVGASVIVKGVRSIKDFEYEKQMADINRMMTGIETVMLVADDRYASISSSIVRELIKYGQDISLFVPDSDFFKE